MAGDARCGSLVSALIIEITRNFAMQYELGYEYLDDKTTKE